MNTAIRDFDDWQDMITAVCGYFTLTPSKTRSFMGNIELGRYGNMDIAEISGNVDRIKKTGRDVSRSDDANLFLILGVEGEAILEQCGASARLGVGDICLIDSRRPSEFSYKDGFKQISVHLPEMQAREVFRNRDIPLAQTLDFQNNTMLRNCILNMYHRAHVGDDIHNLSVPNALELEQNDKCFELLWQAISGEEHGVDSDVLNAQMCRRVNKYIEENLANPELDLEDISRACGITRRSLHRLFERYGLSPFNWIRMRRLELARNALMHMTTNGACTDVAFKYGFNSSAHFSRVFKHKFGLSPRQFQNQIRVYS